MFEKRILRSDIYIDCTLLFTHVHTSTFYIVLFIVASVHIKSDLSMFLIYFKFLMHPSIHPNVQAHHNAYPVID